MRRRKVGIITSADLRPTGDKVHRLDVAGYLFERDFPEVVNEMARRKGELGMSYEIADVRVVDTEAPVWVATDFKFTGAAVLLRDKAAYQGQHGADGVSCSVCDGSTKVTDDKPAMSRLFLLETK